MGWLEATSSWYNELKTAAKVRNSEPAEQSDPGRQRPGVNHRWVSLIGSFVFKLRNTHELSGVLKNVKKNSCDSSEICEVKTFTYKQRRLQDRQWKNGWKVLFLTGVALCYLRWNAQVSIPEPPQNTSSTSSTFFHPLLLTACFLTGWFSLEHTETPCAQSHGARKTPSETPSCKTAATNHLNCSLFHLMYAVTCGQKSVDTPTYCFVQGFLKTFALNVAAQRHEISKNTHL